MLALTIARGFIAGLLFAFCALGTGCQQKRGYTEHSARLVLFDTLRIENNPAHSYDMIRLRGVNDGERMVLGGYGYLNALVSGKVVFDSRQATGEAGQPIKEPVVAATWQGNLLHVLYLQGRVYRYTEEGSFHSKVDLKLPNGQLLEYFSTLVYAAKENRYYVSLAVDGVKKGTPYTGQPFIGAFDAKSGQLLVAFGKYPESYGHERLVDIRKHHFVIHDNQVVVGLTHVPLIWHFSLDGQFLKEEKLPPREKQEGSKTGRRWFVTTVLAGQKQGNFQYLRFGLPFTAGTLLLLADPGEKKFATIQAPDEVELMAAEVAQDTLSFFCGDHSDTTEDLWLYRGRVVWD